MSKNLLAFVSFLVTVLTAVGFQNCAYADRHDEAKAAYKHILDNPAGPENGLCHIPMVGRFASKMNGNTVAIFKMESVALMADKNLDGKGKLNSTKIAASLAPAALGFLNSDFQNLINNYGGRWHPSNLSVGLMVGNSEFSSCFTKDQAAKFTEALVESEQALHEGYAREYEKYRGFSIASIPGKWYQGVKLDGLAEFQQPEKKSSSAPLTNLTLKSVPPPSAADAEKQRKAAEVSERAARESAVTAAAQELQRLQQKTSEMREQRRAWCTAESSRSSLCSCRQFFPGAGKGGTCGQ